MKTINAKDLRTNLKDIIDQAKQGQPIRVTYRNQPAVIIHADPEALEKPSKGSPEAVLQALDELTEKENIKALRRKYQNPDLDPKQAYYRAMAEKYGFKKTKDKENRASS